MSGFLGGADLSDGSNILGHVLGGNQPNVENNLSQNTGVSSDKIGMILKMAAPILMAYLAKNAKQSGINENDESSAGGGISDILGGLLGGNEGSSTSGAGGLLTSALDQNGDGKLTIDDAVSAASKHGGIGGIFGKIFGK